MTQAANFDGDPRLDSGLQWADRQLNATLSITPVAGDASFRRYFRLASGTQSWILMDAPADVESSHPFVDIASRLRSAGLHAPEVIAKDLDRGYLLLEDLGDALLRESLSPENAEDWMPRLFDVLYDLSTVDSSGLPRYDRTRLLEELSLFPDWYLGRHKGLDLDCTALDRWEDLCTRLLSSAAEQPQVFVHRDFHSANLLLAPDGGIGVIDFQDGVHGPITYDFASLIWDRYITWPRPRIERWMQTMHKHLAPETRLATWIRWCDWMGLQRNIKIVGIFARLHYRDGKAGYLEMIPRFWNYVQDGLKRYPEFAAFDALLEELKCAP